MQTNTETRASLITQASALLLERPFTREASAKFDRLMILADAMDIQVDEFRKAQSGAVQAELRSESEKAFRRYIRTGSEVEELRTYSPMGTTSTAAFLAEQWKAEYQSRLASASGILKAGATVVDLKSGAKYLSFYSDDTSNLAEILAEQVQLNDSANPSNPVASVSSPTVVKLATSTQVSSELIQDSAFDIDSYIQSLFAVRVARRFNNYASVDGTAGVLSQFTVGATAASSTVPTLAELSDMQSPAQLDPAYLDGAVYMMSPAMRSTLMKQIDSTGRRIYPEISKGELMGFPIVTNVDQPSSAASVAVCFGNFTRALLVQSTPQILVRSVERYAEFNTVYFALFHRMGIKITDADAVTALKLHS
jgi:HK97 family phage major capsid protein